MHHSITISKTDLARRTRQVVDRARRGEPIIVESYGEEQVVVMDATDYRILRAVASYRSLPSPSTPATDPDVEPAGLTEEEVERVAQAAPDSLQARWDRVMVAYLGGHISQGRAAELLDLSAYELDERFRRLDVPRRIGPETVEEAQGEVDVALGLAHKLGRREA